LDLGGSSKTTRTGILRFLFLGLRSTRRQKVNQETVLMARSWGQRCSTW
jgi:hypothetical protein